MKKYEEEHYQFENIKEHIYPWIRKELKDKHALNGKNLSEEGSPVWLLWGIRRSSSPFAGGRTAMRS